MKPKRAKKLLARSLRLAAYAMSNIPEEEMPIGLWRYQWGDELLTFTASRDPGDWPPDRAYPGGPLMNWANRDEWKLVK